MIEIISEYEAFIGELIERGNIDTSKYVLDTKKIILDILQNGNDALFKYIGMWESKNININNIKVERKSLKNAYDTIDCDLRKTIEKSAERIKTFHEKQKEETWMDIKENGEILGQKVCQIDCVGIYVPGGKASYPSTVLMNAIPAKVAGVKHIIMTTPSHDGKINDAVLAAAYIAGVDEVYQVGGAQAIAAMAYGTTIIPKVSKIVGPGNIYVALAKKEVFGHVDIDSIAGPSEILIIADEYSNPKYIAADLLSQAEHDELASGILLTNSEKLAHDVKSCINVFYNKLSRKDILEKSLKKYSKIILTKSIDESIEISNRIAPEHLEISTKDPFSILPKIKNAGAVFLGEYTPEALGDYMAGPNHVLPTSGTARFFSPLQTSDFLKKTSIISFSKEALLDIYQDVSRFAYAEGLDAHALSANIRSDNE